MAITLERLLVEAEANYMSAKAICYKYTFGSEKDFFYAEDIIKETKKQYDSEMRVYRKLLKEYFDYDYEIPELKESGDDE